MKKCLLFSLVACLFLMLAACGESTDPQKAETTKTEAGKIVSQPAATAAECNLTMGWDPWEPYQYLTPDGEVRGLEVDLLSAMANEAGCDVTFVQDNWVNLLAGIRDGSIDMLGGATKTESREKFAYFSDNYRCETFLLYIRAGEAEKFTGKSLQELLEGGFRLGVTAEYLYGDEVNALQDNEKFSSNFVHVPITEVNYYNLTQGYIDGFLEDPFVAAYTVRRKGLQGQIEALPLIVHSTDVSIIFSKESVDEEAVQAFNKALEKLKEDGEYDQILAKYRRVR